MLWSLLPYTTHEVYVLPMRRFCHFVVYSDSDACPLRNRDKQVSFYCSAQFSELLHAEKIRRGLSIQEMIIKALTEYLQRPTADDLRQFAAQENAAAQKLRKTGHVDFGELPPRFDMQRFIDLCVKYFQRMPKAKRQVLEEFIMLDLKHYGSSRLKQKD